MSIPSRRIGKVIIGGQWFNVKLDSFEILEMEFTDPGGNPIHNQPLDEPAYRFVNDNGDTYYGPLRTIELYKLIDI